MTRFRLDRSRLALGVVCLLMLAYSVVFSIIALRRHQAFYTAAFDLGNMDQAVWNTLHGRILRQTNIEGVDNRLAHHVEPILLPISLLYLPYSGPEMLLVLQTVVIALGALPAFWLARDVLVTSSLASTDGNLEVLSNSRMTSRACERACQGNDFAGILFATAYLLFPPLEGVNMNHFHAVALASSFLLFAIYFMWRRGYALFFAFALLSMSCKEEIPLLVAMMGLYILFIHRNWKVGALTVLLGVAWFSVAFYVVIPHFNPAGKSPFVGYWDYLGGNPLEIAVTLLTKPRLAIETLLDEARLEYLHSLLAPFAYTSLLSPQTLFLALPSLFIDLFSTDWFMHCPGLFFHYPAPIVPFVVASSICGVALLARWLGRGREDRERLLAHLLPALVLLVGLYQHRYHALFSPLAEGFTMPRPTAHHRLVQGLAALIPAHASVSAMAQLDPHVSQREVIYLFPKVDDAEYVFIDVTPTNVPLITRDFYHSVRQLLENDRFGISASRDGYLLLRRGLTNSTPTEEFYTFARAEDPQIEYPMRVDFGHSLQLLGFDVVRERSVFLQVYLNLYWRLLEPVDGDYRFFTFLLDSEGRPIEGSDFELVAPVWYPVSRWGVGEVVKTETLHWEIRDTGQLSVAITVFEGPSQWDVERRLRPRIVESDALLGLLQGDTLLELVTFRHNERVVKVVE